MNKQKLKYEKLREEIHKKYKERINELEKENHILLVKLMDLKSENIKLENQISYLEEKQNRMPDSLKALLELRSLL